ncbi:hypothetical protein SAY87_028059 [Trapa incisa]|uniref:Rho termination factor-like N-terminal domain-containing protein n=1 Tax=Trapa incisa TaxID=236973 RepID=A0AAN7KU67_9MYRT|nr:hypothetical protein SAY87_028059 [Trapa incisa]
MSWDLWGPSVEPEFRDSRHVQPLFYHGFGVDVIEEDTLNEMYSMQVLRILIAKADAEINELEECLILLQCQMAWEEHQDLCNTLKTAETVILDVRDTLIPDSNMGNDKTDSDLQTACEEPFLQSDDVIVELNSKKTSEESLEPKSYASGDIVMQPATGNTILDSRTDLQNLKHAKADKVSSLSLGKEGEREDGKLYLASILQLVDQGNTERSLIKTHKEEGGPAELVRLHDVTVHEESKWGLKLLDRRLRRKKKRGLDGPGAERSLFSHKEICSHAAKPKEVRRFRAGNSYSKPSRSKMGKKMVLALSAFPPKGEEEIFETSNGRPDTSSNMSSSISDEMGLDDMLNAGLPVTRELDSLHKQLVEMPSSAARVYLKNMRLNDLRAIAKEMKLKRYYKLSKKALVEKIANCLDSS